MIPCPSCRRHIKPSAAACPFCGTVVSPDSPAVRAFNAAAASVTMVVLSACYGPPSSDKYYDSGDSGPLTYAYDLDYDGVSTPEDCDDTNPDVFPGQVEDCANGVDDDCDTRLDLDDPDCGGPTGGSGTTTITGGTGTFLTTGGTGTTSAGGTGTNPISSGSGAATN